MFDNIEDAIAYIESKRNKRTLKQFLKTLEKCQINLKQKNMIHIAGTNGKGSTVNYLRSILNAHGYHVGTFTSPYLVKHNDRIRIDDQPISDLELLSYINRYYDIIEQDGLSMFEIDVLIMLTYFQSLDLDYRIIETGIGGKHDKTNVIEPVVSAITNIGRDHEDMLGHDLYSILNEKIGIIKPNQMFFTSEKHGLLLSKMQEECDKQKIAMHVVPECPIRSYPFSFYFKGTEFVLNNQGVYQVSNAKLALYIADKLIDLKEDITKEAIDNCVWKGRFETLRYKDTLVYIDGAHNVPAIEELIHTLKLRNMANVVVIISPLVNKNVDEMLGLLLKEEYDIYLTTFNDERSIELDKFSSSKHLKVVHSFEEALNTAYILKKNIVVTGSLHFISMVRKYLVKKD